MYAYIHTYIHRSTYVHVHTYKCIHIHTHTYTHIDAGIHIHVHINEGTYFIYSASFGLLGWISFMTSKKTIFSNSYREHLSTGTALKELEVTINPFRWVLGHPYFPNQGASGYLPNEGRNLPNQRALGHLLNERSNSYGSM